MSRQWFQKATPENGHVHVNATNFIVSADGFQTTVDWSSVRRIAFYKIDLFNSKELHCAIEFERANQLFTVDVPEKLIGYNEFLAALEENLPGCRQRVQTAPFQPATETNFTIAFERSSRA